MARPAMRVCPTAGCPELTPGGPCVAHRRQREQQRGTRQARGYDAQHDRLRRQWARRINTGTVRCARCTKPILPGSDWHLDHSDDRLTYLGASCATCNTSAGGKAAHR